MKVIFLDIDGVLNRGIALNAFSNDSIHEDLVKNINTVIDNDTKIVLISTWKDVYSYEKICNFLYQKGLKKDTIIGMTEKDSEKEKGISAYLENHKKQINSFIIVDDSLDPKEKLFQEQLIKPNTLKGFEEYYIKTALKKIA